MDDSPCLVAAVDAQMQVELRCRLQVPSDESAVEIDDRDLLGVELGEGGAGRRDRDELPCALADVAGGPDHESLGGQPPGRVGYALSLGLEWSRAAGRIGLHRSPRYRSNGRA